MVKVNIWYPINTPLNSLIGWTAGAVAELVPGVDLGPHRWGHAGVKFKDVPGRVNAYFAFWPAPGRPDQSQPMPGYVRISRHGDMALEGEGFVGRSLPDRVVVCDPGWITPEREVAAYDYWVRLATNPPTYWVWDFNCCKAVAASLNPGTTTASFFNPFYLEQWLLTRGRTEHPEPVRRDPGHY